MPSPPIDALRQQFASITDRVDDPGRTPAADLLATRIRGAERAALDRRNNAASFLAIRHGWSLTRLSRRIFGNGNKASVVRDMLADPVLIDDPVAELDAAVSEIAELRALGDEVRAWVIAHPPAPSTPAEDLSLPTEPVARTKAAAARLASVRTELAQVRHRRNIIAAGMTVYHRWPVTRAARAVGAGRNPIYQAQAAAATEIDPATNPAELESELEQVIEQVARLSALETALVAARDEAMTRMMDAGARPSEAALTADVKSSYSVHLYRSRRAAAVERAKPAKASRRRSAV